MEDKNWPMLKPTKKQLKQLWRVCYKDVCPWVDFYEACWDFEVSLDKCIDVETRLRWINPDKYEGV